MPDFDDIHGVDYDNIHVTDYDDFHDPDCDQILEVDYAGMVDPAEDELEWLKYEDPWRQEQYRSLLASDYVSEEESQEILQPITRYRPKRDADDSDKHGLNISGIRISIEGTMGESQNTGSIQKPPAYRLDRMLRFLVTRKSYKRIYREIIEDMREEFNEAMSQGDNLHAKWIKLRCYLSVTWAALIQFPATIIAAVIRKLGNS